LALIRFIFYVSVNNLISFKWIFYFFEKFNCFLNNLSKFIKPYKIKIKGHMLYDKYLIYTKNSKLIIIVQSYLFNSFIYKQLVKKLFISALTSG